MIPETDTQYRETVVARVIDGPEFFYVTGEDGWSIAVPKAKETTAPQTGEPIRFFGRGIGHPVRGIVIGGRVYSYQTEEEQRADFDRQLAEDLAKREREFTEKKVETDRRIEALPEIFRDRIYKFQRDGGHEFRRDYECYELFCCEQAVVFANQAVNRSENGDEPQVVEHWRADPKGDSLLPPVRWLLWWNALNSERYGYDYKRQRAEMLGMEEGHSGNTFGAAITLARFYLDSPEYVTKMHGALTPLVGCEAYGCAHPKTEAES